MTAIYYNEADDRIVIEGALQTYAPRTLRAVFDEDGRIMIRLKVRASNEFGPFPYSELMDGAGQGFADRMAAMSYLNSVFRRRPLRGDRYSVGIAISERGQTVIPLDRHPNNFASLRLVVNGVEYRVPDIAVSPVAVTWPSDAFPLDPADRVTVVYS